jgi:hypothetical protein
MIRSVPDMRCLSGEEGRANVVQHGRYAASVSPLELDRRIVRHIPVPDCGRRCLRIAHERDLLDV